jgi:hypothetical protein
MKSAGWEAAVTASLFHRTPFVAALFSWTCTTTLADLCREPGTKFAIQAARDNRRFSRRVIGRVPESISPSSPSSSSSTSDS